MTIADRPLRFGRSRIARGFTLVELAVVVLVVGLLIGSLLVPLSTQVDQRNIADTQRRLEDAREALFGFAVANGRFPCPASTTSNGQESFCTSDFPSACGTPILVPPSTPPTHGRCTNFFDGYLPAQVLGMNNLDSSGYALDAYPLSQGNQGRIRYVIADLTINPGPSQVLHGLTAPGTTSTGAMRSANMLGVSSTGYLLVCSTYFNTTACPAVTGGTVAQNVAFIVYSLGKNGTNVVNPSDEYWNLNVPGNQRTFVNRTYSSVATGGGTFDDQLLWVSSYALISRMVVAGALP